MDSKFAHPVCMLQWLCNQNRATWGGEEWADENDSAELSPHRLIRGQQASVCSPKKEVEGKGEEIKVAIRNVRRDANDKSKAMKKNGEMTEDELKQSDKTMQDLTDKYIKEIDTLTAVKEKEIMAI